MNESEHRICFRTHEMYQSHIICIRTNRHNVSEHILSSEYLNILPSCFLLLILKLHSTQFASRIQELNSLELLLLMVLLLMLSFKYCLQSCKTLRNTNLAN